MRGKVVLLLLCLAVPSFAKKKSLSPDDFPLTAQVTGYSSREVVTGMTSNRPSFCDSQKETWQQTYCAAAGNHSSASTSTSYVVTAEIGDRIYELEGAAFSPGNYKARFGTTKKGVRIVQMLDTDNKGRLRAWGFWIVGERVKQ